MPMYVLSAAAEVCSSFVLQILPFRTEVSGNMTLVWRVMRPFLSPLAQASTLLTYKPLHDLTTASRGYAALAWQIVVKTAEIWGLASPCAVKVLQDRSPNAGAYGSRSVEHEVRSTVLDLVAYNTVSSLQQCNRPKFIHRGQFSCSVYAPLKLAAHGTCRY